MSTHNDKSEHERNSTYWNLAQGENAIIIRDRFDSLYSMMNDFINANNLTEQVRISVICLEQALIAYFDDINRIKTFHGMGLVNEIKIRAHTAFWILRKKPLQILKDYEHCESVNEKFISFYLMDFMLREKSKAVLSGSQKDQYTEFVKTLNYWFKYRKFDAQSIELILLSFIAGTAVEHSLYNNDTEQ